MVKLKRRKDESSLIAAFRRIRISSMPPTKLILLEMKILLYDNSRKSFYAKYFMENYKKFVFKKCISLHSTNEEEISRLK